MALEVRIKATLALACESFLVLTSFTATVYSGTKFAVEALSDSLRRELRSFGVSVSIVEPAYVKTAIGDKSSGEHASDHWVAKDMLKVWEGGLET